MTERPIMPHLHVLELTSSNADGLPRLPALRSQSIEIGVTSVTSAPFGEGARAIRICADVDCAITVGSGELVASESDMPLAAGKPEIFATNPGDRIAVVGRAMEDDRNDPFALFEVIANPEACKKRMRDLKTSSDELRKLQTEISNAQSVLAQERAAMAKDLTAERAKHDDELAQAKRDFEAERLRKENALAAREARVAEAEAQAKADAEAAAMLKADLRRRLDLLHQAGAA